MPGKEERSEGTVIWLDSARNGRRAERPEVPDTTTVVITGGRSLMRAGVRMLLEADEQITVIGDTSWGEDAMALVRRARPDVVLIDPTGCDLDTRTVASLYALAGTGAAVMLLTEPESEAELHAALRAGARGVLGGNAGPAELSRAIRLLARGDAVLSPATIRRLLAAFAATSPTLC
jgi:DNA-binding NarL/FixJ family response regulator